MPMNRFVVLGIGTLLLLFAGCAKPTSGSVERCLDLPNGLGSLYIELDSNLTHAGRWQHASDYKCGREWVKCYSYTDWPVHRDTDYFNSFPDSLFQFTLRYSVYSPLECGWQPSEGDERLIVQEMLEGYMKMRQQENLTWRPVDHGLFQIHGVQWGFICTSDSLPLGNDALECFTYRSGRSISMLWQRVAPSPVAFDFERYAMSQLATARFE